MVSGILVTRSQVKKDGEYVHGMVSGILVTWDQIKKDEVYMVWYQVYWLPGIR